MYYPIIFRLANMTFFLSLVEILHHADLAGMGGRAENRSNQPSRTVGRIQSSWFTDVLNGPFL